MNLDLPFNYTPRDYQIPFHNAMCLQGYKRAVAVWHRRAGKDKAFINFTASEMWHRVGIYYYFFPTFAQGRKILWDGIDGDQFKHMDHFPKELRAKTREDEMKIIMKNGSLFQIIGTDNIDAAMGTNPVGCVFSEFSLQNPQAWDLVRPILTENKGWAVFNFTPRGRNHAFVLNEMAKKNPKWWYNCLTVDDTKRPDGSPVISPEAIQDERDTGMDESLVLQEYYCSFDASLSSCFFGKSIARHTHTANGAKGSLSTNKYDDIEFDEDFKGMLEVWRYPYDILQSWDKLHWRDRYVIGSDIGEGLEQDYSVAYVFDRLLQEFVAKMRSNTIDSYAWGKQLILLSRWYNNALLVPERNGSGITVCKYLSDESANLYTQMVPAKAGSGMTKTLGWLETKQSKYDLCNDLKEYFFNTKAIIYDNDLLFESSTFIKTETGRLEADESFHDDCVIAGALAIQGDYFIGGKPKRVSPGGATGWRENMKGKEKSSWAS